MPCFSLVGLKCGPADVNEGGSHLAAAWIWEQGGTGAGPTGEELARYLHRNGVLCEPITVQPEGRSTGEAILAHAASLQCDLLIKGAYTQSRLPQMIFGGATRHILANASLPVLMAH